MRIRFLRILTLAVSSFLSSFPTFLDSSPASLRPGTRVLLDAHNCYPYYEWWFDRIDRALSRSEEHTSELQSQSNLVCRLLLEKKKNVIMAVHSVHATDLQCCISC